TLIWKTRNLEDHTHCTPTLDVARRRIYIGSNRGHFHAFDTAGKQIWRFAVRGAFDPVPDPRPTYRAQIKSTAALAGDRILFTSWDHRLYCLAADTGRELWSFETDHRTMSSPSVDTTGRRVYFGSHDHNVYAIDLDTGKRLWQTTTGGRIYSSALLVPRADGTGMAVVIGSCDSRLYILDAADGTILWQRLLNGPVTNVPYIRNGRLLVSTNGGELVCFE
ncbi:MAG: PQQ-binding-like beta-propeller repeat protein, partial [Pirellulales bacterium]